MRVRTEEISEPAIYKGATMSINRRKCPVPHCKTILEIPDDCPPGLGRCPCKHRVVLKLAWPAEKFGIEPEVTVHEDKEVQP